MPNNDDLRALQRHVEASQLRSETWRAIATIVLGGSVLAAAWRLSDWVSPAKPILPFASLPLTDETQTRLPLTDRHL